MKTAEICNNVIEVARKVAKRETQRFPEAASPQDAERQGDIYIVLLAKVPEGAKKIPVPSQLAVGTTQGSRHCLDSSVGIIAYARAKPTEFDGPILKLEVERTVTHPEHGDWILPPGIYGIRYQRTMDAMERAQRVAD